MTFSAYISYPEEEQTKSRLILVVTNTGDNVILRRHVFDLTRGSEGAGESDYIGHISFTAYNTQYGEHNMSYLVYSDTDGWRHSANGLIKQNGTSAPWVYVVAIGNEMDTRTGGTNDYVCYVDGIQLSDNTAVHAIIGDKDNLYNWDFSNSTSTTVATVAEASRYRLKY